MKKRLELVGLCAAALVLAAVIFYCLGSMRTKSMSENGMLVRNIWEQDSRQYHMDGLGSGKRMGEASA